MSNYHAIATVTATLHGLLLENLNVSHFSGIKITSKPLDLLENDRPDIGLNIFLYQVLPNVAYQNFDLPTRNSTGEFVKNPVLGLNLFYLLTPYTADTDELSEIRPQQILSKAMMTLHENPILTRNRILETRIINPKIPDKDMDDHLETQIELIKIIFPQYDFDQITKLWSSFFQTHYKLSVPIGAGVVLLESKKGIRKGPPVRERNLYVLPLSRPILQKIEPQIVESFPDAKITLIGENLLAEEVKIMIDGAIIEPDQNNIFSNQIKIGVPPNIQAGIKAVQVMHPLKLGKPPVSHGNWNVSNIGAFVLSPRIIDPDVMITKSLGDILNITIEPAVSEKQKVSVFIGEKELNVKLPAASPTELYPRKILPGVEIPADLPIFDQTESFLLRVRVDGADSHIRFDGDPLSPTFNKYLPFIEISQ